LLSVLYYTTLFIFIDLINVYLNEIKNNKMIKNNIMINYNMRFLNKINGMNQFDMVISFLLIVYILFEDMRPPHGLAIIIDESILAQILIYLFGLGVTLYYNPIVGVLTLFASYEMIRRSKTSTNGEAVYKYLPSQDKVDTTLNSLNQFHITLEEQVVSTMAPLVLDGPVGPASYLPVLDKTEASLLSELDNDSY